MPGTHVHTTVAKIYRRRHAGYACYLRLTIIYREGRKGSKKLLQIRLKLDMYKFGVCIYLNHVPFDSRQKSYGFKILAKLGR